MPESQTSEMRYFYTLTNQDLSTRRGGSYIGPQGSFTAHYLLAHPHLMGWTNEAVVTMSTPGSHSARETLQVDLPTRGGATEWAAYQAGHPGLEFYGTRYTPAAIQRNGYITRAFPGEQPTDFLNALRRAEAIIAEHNQGGAWAPWVYSNPAAESFFGGSAGLTETDDETPPANTNLFDLNTMSSTIKLAETDHTSRCCSTCGRPGHNSRTCTSQTPKSYDKIGIEIEGRFRDLDQRRTEARAVMGTEGSADGSVRGGNTGARPWEFKTRPGTLGAALDQLHEFYPDETDASCGMHIHVSFASTDIFLLANTEFFAYFKQRWTDWGNRMHVRQGTEFWKRLNGENSYCRVNTEVPLDLMNMDRYHQLNFSAWEDHKTVECRLLPMFRKESLALSAVQELISIYDDWFAMAHDTLFPTRDVELPDYSLVPDITAYTVETPGVSFTDAHEFEMVDIAPPAHGMVRVAIPQGRTVDTTDVATRFNRIAQLEQRAAA